MCEFKLQYTFLNVVYIVFYKIFKRTLQYKYTFNPMLPTKHNVAYNEVHINNKTFRTWRTQHRIYKSKRM